MQDLAMDGKRKVSCWGNVLVEVDAIVVSKSEICNNDATAKSGERVGVSSDVREEARGNLYT
jgi:hypothetical protein